MRQINHEGGSKTVILAIAIIMAFTAQYLFTGEVFTRFIDSNTWDWIPRYTTATLLLCAAAVFAGWGVSGTSGPRTLEITGARLPFLSLSLWLLFAAGACYVFSLSSYLVWGESIYTRLLWSGGIALVVIPTWLQSRNGKARSEENIAGWEWMLVAVLTAAGFALRYWRLTELPSGMDNDIPFMGTFGLKLIRNSNFDLIGFSQSSHLLSYDQSIAWSMRLFGKDHYGLVMLSCLSGTVTLPLVFLLGREFFNRRVGLVAAALLAADYTHIHFSRILFGANVMFFAVFVLYFIGKGIRTQQSLWFCLGGVMTGLGLLAYDSSRVVPIIVIAAAAWEWLFHRQRAKANLLNWAVFLFAALVAFGPMLGFLFEDFSSFIGRGHSVALWTPEVWRHEMLVYKADSALDVIIGQIRNTFLTLHLFGDSSPHFAFPRPMVAPLTAALFVAGTSFCLLKLKQTQCLVPLAWIFLTFVLGGVITYDPPYWPHLNITLPAIVVVAGVGADKTIEVFTRGGVRGTVAGWSVFSLAIILTGIFNWMAYYDFANDNAGYKLIVVRYIDSLPKGYQVYMISTEYSWNQHAFRFFNRDVPGQDITMEELQSSPPLITRPTVFFVYDQPDALALLETLYPGGEVTEHRNNENRVLVTSYNVTPEGWKFPPPEEAARRMALPGWWITGGALAFAVFRIFRSPAGRNRR